MDKNHTRSFSTKRGEFTARIVSERFPEGGDTKNVERTKSDRKFNIRIKQDDICLLDALAKHQKTTRAALINVILHEYIRDELMSIEDVDARVLLAHVADLSASYDDLARPWVSDALSANFSHTLNSVLKYSNTHGQPPETSEENYRSPTYIGLRDKLKGISK